MVVYSQYGVDSNAGGSDHEYGANAAILLLVSSNEHLYTIELSNLYFRLSGHKAIMNLLAHSCRHQESFSQLSSLNSIEVPLDRR